MTWCAERSYKFRVAGFQDRVSGRAMLIKGWAPQPKSSHMTPLDKNAQLGFCRIFDSLWMELYSGMCMRRSFNALLPISGRPENQCQVGYSLKAREDSLKLEHHPACYHKRTSFLKIYAHCTLTLVLAWAWQLSGLVDLHTGLSPTRRKWGWGSTETQMARSIKTRSRRCWSRWWKVKKARQLDQRHSNFNY